MCMCFKCVDVLAYFGVPFDFEYPCLAPKCWSDRVIGCFGLPDVARLPEL